MSTSPAAPVDGRRVLARAAWRLIPFLFILYIVSFLDRVNVGFAKLQMGQALGLSDSAFGLGAAVFFLGYAAFEIPSNLLLERVGARRWIARIMITWGLAAAAMAGVTGPVSFSALRFLLGVFEAGFFPGVILYLSYWFPQRERARAVALFMTATAVSNIIGNPLSGQIMARCDGVWGHAGWQWVFVLEGLPAVALAFVVLAYLPDRPSRARWLTAEEAAWLEAEVAASEPAGRSHHLGAALRNPRVWYLSLLYMTITMSLYGLSLWLPSVVEARGGGALSKPAIGLLVGLTYVSAAVAMVVAGQHSDRTGERRWHVSVPLLLGGVALALSGAAPSLGPTLLLLCLAAIGIWSAFGPFWALPTSFLGGTAAAGGIALINSVGNLGGFLGSYVTGWLKTHTGGYGGGLAVMGGVLVLGGLLASGLREPAAQPARRES